MTPARPEGDRAPASVSCQNSRGEWVPSIPLPYYVLTGVRCQCGQRFWTEEAYRGHYALVHILALGKR